MTQRVFFSADSHFGHINIVRGTTNWTDSSRCRDFDTVEDHNQWLIDIINSKVSDSDILYHMGDWSFGGRDNISKFRKALHCNQIHIICGNHDHHISRKPNAFKDLFASITPYIGIKKIQVEDQTIILSHHAMRTWYADNKGSWMLYGHSHGTLRDSYPESKRRTIDVGIDSIGPPVSFEELKEIFSRREIHDIDHHNKTTNAD